MSLAPRLQVSCSESGPSGTGSGRWRYDRCDHQQSGRGHLQTLTNDRNWEGWLAGPRFAGIETKPTIEQQVH